MDAVFRIDPEMVIRAGAGLQRVADSIQRAVPLRMEYGICPMQGKHDLRLGSGRAVVEVHICNGNRFVMVEVMRVEDLQYVFNLQFPMLTVGNALAEITEMLPHFGGKVIPVSLFQKIADAAFPGLGIDADHIAVICTVDILRVNGNVWDGPLPGLPLFAPVHAFCDRILMAAGKRGKHQRSGIRASFMDVHSGTFLISPDDSRHIRQIQLGIYAMRIQIHRQCDDIHIAGPFPVAEKRPFDPLCAG